MTQTTRRAVLAGVGAGALAAAGAHAASAQTPPAAAPPARPRVVFDTALGAITLELAADKAPITCTNFLRYVDAKKFDGQAFFRAMKMQADPPQGLIEGRADPDNRFPPIPLESTKQTGLTHCAGAISMARTTPDSATADFSVCISDLSVALDATDDDPGYAVFGQVVDGLDVARKILLSPVSPTKGAEWGMKGQILDPEIAIVTARRV